MRSDTGNRPTEDQWRALSHNDASSDGAFYYAVATTRIFCRPSCKSRVPNPDNVRVFPAPRQAMEAGYRPCKRCRPLGDRDPEAEWVDQMVRCLDRDFAEPVTLEWLAEKCHGSRFHLQRIFKRVQGISPAGYLQQVRVAKAAEFLAATEKSVTEISQLVGVATPAHFATLFKKTTGLSPTEYRQQVRKQA